MDIKLMPEELKKIYDRGIINIGNLHRFSKVIDKALSGEGVTIGFIGGSITAGSLSSSPNTCYAYLIYSWWKERFPRCNIEYINAGVGATTSLFGVARLNEDLLCKKPDLVFVEFSVNDSDNNLFMETYEGLIVKLLSLDTEPAVVIINNVFYDTGLNSQGIHNKIGKYYELPIVSIRDSIYPEVHKDIIKAKDITSDNLHPNDMGHHLVAGAIINLLDTICIRVDKDKSLHNQYMIPKNPITANRYINSKRLDNRNTKPILAGFIKDKSEKAGIWDVFKNGWSGSKIGDCIELVIEGSIILIQYRKYAIHPAPVAKVVLDNDEENPYFLDAKFDETWGDSLYLQDIINDGIPRIHKLVITVIEEVRDKEFYLAAVLSA